MDKRRLAQIRNYNKFRLLGFSLDQLGLTALERAKFKKFKDDLLNNWDENSSNLGLNPLPTCARTYCNNKVFNKSNKYCKFHELYERA